MPKAMAMTDTKPKRWLVIPLEVQVRELVARLLVAAIAADHPVITVATNSGTPTEVAAHLAREGVRFPVLMDETGAIARQWGVSGVPAAFIVGTDGVISHAGVGYSTEYGLRLRLWLAD